MRAERGQNNRNIKQLEFITLWLESTVKVVQLLKVNKKSKVEIKSIYTISDSFKFKSRKSSSGQ